MALVSKAATRKAIRKAQGNTFKARSVMRKTWKKLCTPPLSQRNRRKASFVERHKQELPSKVIKLLRESGRQEKNRLMNLIGAKLRTRVFF